MSDAGEVRVRVWSLEEPGDGSPKVAGALVG